MSSATSATVPNTHAADAPAWLEIPRLAGVLLWRHWPALLFWFFAQRVAYDLLMDLAIKLAEHGALLSYAAIAVLIVTQLIGTIGMFLVLRSSLALPARKGAEERPVNPWVTALAVALLPFFAYYASWGLLDGVRRDFRMTYGMNVSFDNRENLRDIFSLHGLWFALLAAWAVREFAKRRMAATGHSAWAVLTTICEAYWVFVGVAAIAKTLAMLRDWWHERVVYVAIADWWDHPFLDLPFAGLISLAPLKRVFDPAWRFLADAAAAISMPLVWLAITALIYGLDLRRLQRLDRSDARVRYAVRRYARLHTAWHMAANRLSSGWNSKIVPLLNSLRLVLRAGLPALLTLCLCWQLLAFADSVAWLGLVKLLGAHSREEWEIVGQPWALLFSSPLGVRPALLTELLRVVLLAATFACAISRVAATRARGRDRT